MEVLERISTIDCRGAPSSTKGFRWKENLKEDRIAVGARELYLYQPGRATNPFMTVMTGYEFREYAQRGDHLLNAHLLDYFVAHPEHYPEEWKPWVDGKFRKIFFFGSVFETDNSLEAAACLFWDWEHGKSSTLTKIHRELRLPLFADCFAASLHPY